jgi:hypothetical protein
MAVTSVALSDGSTTPIYAISGSPVTSSGTLTFSLKTETANLVFAGPTSGSAAQPTFRALVAADLPSNGANPTGTVGLSTVNGSATTWMRSDAAPPLSQAISPTWTGNHTFTPTSGAAITVNAASSSVALTVNANSSSAAIQLNQTAGALVAGYNTAGTTRTGYLDFIGGTAGGGGATETALDNDGATVNDWLSLVSGGVRRVRIDGTGQVTINTPTSGLALTVNQNSGATAGIQINATAGNALLITGNVAGPAIVSMTLLNTNNGSGNTAISGIDVADNNGNDLTIQLQGTGNTGSLVTGGPAGLYGFIGTNTAFPFAIITDLAQRIGVSASGAVTFNSISTTASAANAFLDSTANNNLLRSTSSRRYKCDIEALEYGRAERIVRRLRLVHYRSLAEADDPQRTHYGLVAEEVAAVDTSLVSFDSQGRADGVQYDRVAMLLLPLVQRLLNG